MIQVLEFDRWLREQEVFTDESEFQNFYSCDETVQKEKNCKNQLEALEKTEQQCNDFIKAQWIDFTTLEGTNGYCDEEAAAVITEKTADGMRESHPVTWIGNGNYHYVAHLLTMQIKEPFSLVVFDHHPDMQPSFFAELLSCGSWVLHALKQNPFLQQVILIGVKEELLQALPENPDVVPVVMQGELAACFYQFICYGKTVTAISESFFQDPQHEMSVLGTWINRQLDGAVYLSVDKDVLCREDCMTNWDSGSMRLWELLELLELFLRNHGVIGMDFCGESSESSEPGALENNRSCNAQILQKLKEEFDV